MKVVVAERASVGLTTRGARPAAAARGGRARARAWDDGRASKAEVERRTFGEGVQQVLKKAQIVALSCACLLGPPLDPPALAILKGNPNAKIPRSPEAALRRSTPVMNAEMADIQNKLEDVAFLLRIPQRKQWDKMEQKVTECRDKAKSEGEIRGILKDVPEAARSEATEYIESMDVALGQALRGIAYRDAAYTTKYLNAALANVNSIELAQAVGLPFSVPQSLQSKFPYLAGRATLKFTIKKRPGVGKLYVLDAETRQDAVGTFVVDLDGYSAPVTAGQLLKNVSAGMYDGQAIAQDLNATALLVGPPTEAAPLAPPLPLEIFQTGEFEPSYNTQLDVLNMEYPILPMSIFGAVVMSHDAGDALRSSTDRFFIYKFEESMGGLAGLSFDEGQFSVVGYVTQGSDLITQVEGGDIIEKVEIVSGGDRLREPQV